MAHPRMLKTENLLLFYTSKQAGISLLSEDFFTPIKALEHSTRCETAIPLARLQYAI